MADKKEILKNGEFGKMLTRSNKALREDRALKIAAAAEKAYRRKVEDLDEKLENLIIDRENLLDVNPGNTQTIINPSDFDQDAFIQKDIAMGVEIRNVEIKLEIAKKRYAELFSNETAK